MSFVCSLSLSLLSFLTQQSTSNVSRLVCTGVGWLRLDFDNTCTGNTADQAVSTVHLQLGAAKHLTRPLTYNLKIRYI